MVDFQVRCVSADPAPASVAVWGVAAAAPLSVSAIACVVDDVVNAHNTPAAIPGPVHLAVAVAALLADAVTVAAAFAAAAAMGPVPLAVDSEASCCH